MKGTKCDRCGKFFTYIPCYHSYVMFQGIDATEHTILVKIQCETVDFCLDCFIPFLNEIGKAEKDHC